MPWTTSLADQLDWHWHHQLRPRLDGLCSPCAARPAWSWHYAADAQTALHQLDDAYRNWITGVRALSDDDLGRPCGPAEHGYSEHPMSELILHINREVIHHGAEIACLRDLYSHTHREGI